jgi:hypothetical protein
MNEEYIMSKIKENLIGYDVIPDDPEYNDALQAIVDHHTQFVSLQEAKDIVWQHNLDVFRKMERDELVSLWNEYQYLRAFENIEEEDKSEDY